jgi:hypothetical protein
MMNLKYTILFALLALAACGTDEEGQVWFSCDCETSCNGGPGDVATDPQFACAANTTENASTFGMEAYDSAKEHVQSFVADGLPACPAPEGYVVLCQCRATTETCT